MAQPVSVTQPIIQQGCDYVDEYDWDTSTARAICMAESSGNTNATNYNTNGSTDMGLMQVNSIHADMVSGDLQSLYDPATNVRIAYAIYQSAGWRAWSTFLNGAYTKYL